MMARKQVQWWIWPAALAGLLGLWFLVGLFPLGQPGGDTDFRTPAGITVAMVKMETPGSGVLRLYNHPHNGWIVGDGLPVNVPAVEDLLRTLRGLNVRRPVSLSDNEGLQQRLEQKGVGVEVFSVSHWLPLPGGGGLLPRLRRVRHFLVGPDVANAMATYMWRPGSDLVYEVGMAGVDAGLEEVFLTEIHHWLDNLVLAISPGALQEIHMDYSGRYQDGFVVKRGEDGVYLLYNKQGRPVDENNINRERFERFLKALAHLRYERLLPGSAIQPPSDAWEESPFLSMQASADGGVDMTIEFFRRDRPRDGSLVSDWRDYDVNRFYLRVNGGDYALARYFDFAPLLRVMDDFSLVKNQ